jgi:glutamate--cysteine ligase catalytic subunit
MGLLIIDGNETLDYKASKKYQKKLKRAGLLQLLQIFKKYAHESKDFKRFPKFGYEIEGHLLKDVSGSTDIMATKNYQLQLESGYMKKDHSNFTIVDEYGRWMLEIIPKAPFEDFLYAGNLLSNIKQVFVSMGKLPHPQDYFLCFPLPPKLGTLAYPSYLRPELKSFSEFEAENQASRSEFLDDSIINTHPRFPTLTQNCRIRRGEKPKIVGDVFKDDNTDMQTVMPGEKMPGQIELDAFSFGMGLSSLQVTFGVANLTQARWLYDQFHIFTPLFLALSGSMPFYKGKLLDSDTRWEFLCQAVDDRTQRERLPGGIVRSRYGSIGLFLSADKKNLNIYNDSKRTLNKWARKYLKAQAKLQGLHLDTKLLDHFAFLFVRDNLCVFSAVAENEPNINETKLFEAIQSSNWNDVRFKPPPNLDSKIGWRVEFRSIDVQVTPEQTFLFTHAVQILSRILIKMHDDLNFYIPITKIDENFRRASLIGAATEQKFFFRTNIFDQGPPIIEELTLQEIFEGKVSSILI